MCPTGTKINALAIYATNYRYTVHCTVYSISIKMKKYDQEASDQINYSCKPTKK